MAAVGAFRRCSQTMSPSTRPPPSRHRHEVSPGSLFERTAVGVLQVRMRSLAPKPSRRRLRAYQFAHRNGLRGSAVPRRRGLSLPCHPHCQYLPRVWTASLGRWIPMRGPCHRHCGRPAPPRGFPLHGSWSHSGLSRRMDVASIPGFHSRLVPLDQLGAAPVPLAPQVPNPYTPRLLHPEPNGPNGQVLPFPGRSYPPAPLSSASPLHPTSALSLRGAQLSVRPSTIPLPNSLRPQSMNRPPPMTMQAQSMPLPDEDDGHVPIPHRIEDMGDGLARQPPSSQEKPPAWHDIEERPHLIEVELDELELHPDAPDLQAGWFEPLRYFISLHPRSEEPDHIPLPRDPPLQSVDGHYLVSQAQRAYKPAAQVGFSEDGPNQNLVATFEEAMSLPMEKLDHHLVAYVWAIKSGMMGAQTTTLVGRALAPLQDFQLQRKTTTWGIFDILAGHRVAEMRLRYHVCTTPAAVEDIQSADVKQSEVTVRWVPPKNDHGAQVIGYQISILLDPKPNEPPQWYRLCECTKSKTPVYVVANLKGNTAYLLDIRAVNKVGAGDAHEFQITTAPVAPDPPSKPWVEEARDGCLNVAWYSTENDGGMPITAYRIKMRKILGASRWNPFGPGETAASWVEMGSVLAAGDASMYNAWVGPLEVGACEYRFQIQALNKLGESKASELSDPHYT